MFKGGTDWGFVNGANIGGGKYEPGTTSYDYSAPLNEAGDPTPAYYALRKLFTKYAPNHKLPPVPSQVPLIKVAPFNLPLAASLWSNLPTPHRSRKPEGFAQFNLQAGYMLYRTKIHGPIKGVLNVGGARDYDIVYINGRRVATLNRMLHQHEATIDVPGSTAQLSILVEDTGRINYGPKFPTDRKGLIFPVTLNNKLLYGWESYPMPLEHAPALHWSRKHIPGPAFHRGTFTLKKTGNTFLDVSQLGKGLLWVNGHAIGRIWHIGPQQSDFVPACWLHKGINTVTVFDLDTESSPKISGKTHHAYALQPPIKQ